MARRIPYDGDLPVSLAVVPEHRIAIIGGQVAPDGTPEDIREQTRATLASLDQALAKLGVTRSAVVRCLCFLSDINDRAAFNEVYEEFFVDDYPTRATVGVQLSPGLLVEIEAMVELPD